MSFKHNTYYNSFGIWLWSWWWFPTLSEGWEPQ